MRVKARNQAEWILQAAVLGLLLLWYRILASLFRYRFFYFTSDPMRYVFRWILFIVACVSLVLYLMQRFSGKRSDFKGFVGCLPLSAAELVLFFVLYMGSVRSFYYQIYRFLIGTALIAALALVTWIGYFRASKLGVVEVPSRWKRADSVKQFASPTPRVSADELRKYKELLDDGAITQGEFDQIKRQMLGL